jgi:hypothetical protein
MEVKWISKNEIYLSSSDNKNSVTISIKKERFLPLIPYKNKPSVVTITHNTNRLEFVVGREGRSNIIYSNNIITVWFDAWRHEREANFALIPLVKTIAYTMGKHPVYKTMEPRLLRGINSISKHHTPRNLGTKATERMSLELEKDTIYFDGMNKIEEEMNHIRRIYPESRVIVFIDNLDKCSPQKIVETIDSIMFLRIEGFVFVIALSYEMLSKLVSIAYGDAGITMQDDMSQAIQIAIHIPPWDSNSIAKFIESQLPKLDDQYRALIGENLSIITTGIEKNPEEAKKFIKNLIFKLNIYSSSHIHPKNLLIKEILQTRWPGFVLFLTSNKQFLEKAREYASLRDDLRIEHFNKEKEVLPKEYSRILSNYISDNALWELLKYYNYAIFDERNWSIF